MTETAGNHNLVRFEPSWLYFSNIEAHAAQNGITYDTEKMMQACSWGLCQVMGSVAREHGYTGLLHCQKSAENVMLGARILKRLFQKYSTSEEVAAAYNGGVVVKLNGKFRNQSYVDRVMAYARELR